MKNFGKKFYIRTFGCQMNIRDSEFISGILIDAGFLLTDSPEKADIIIFNSCSVRKHAEDRLFGNIHDLKKLKEKKPGLIVVLMGCTAQAYGAAAFKKASLIDIVCGTGNECDIARLIADFARDRSRITACDKIDKKRPEFFPEYREGNYKSYVSIGQGCNNYCSYCIVPYVRGQERSRRKSDIIKEVKSLSSMGFEEVTLLGQNVNSYGRRYGRASRSGRYEFIRLLESVNKIKGIKRIRFMTSHPKDAHRELFMAMRDLDKVCEHLHLPLQSGSDRILKLMNRGYDVKRYRKLVDDYRKYVAGGSLTTDIIVGFPGETDKDFMDTCRVMEEAGFNSCYSFQYSPRPPAKSALLDDDVSAGVKKERLSKIMEIQAGIALRANMRFVGSDVEVLFESFGKKDRSYLSGRTRENMIAIAKAPKSYMGKIVNVRVESVTAYTLAGRV